MAPDLAHTHSHALCANWAPTNLATAGAGTISRLDGPGIDLLNAAQLRAHLGYAGLFTAAALLALVGLLILRGVPDPAAGKSSAAGRAARGRLRPVDIDRIGVAMLFDGVQLAG